MSHAIAAAADLNAPPVTKIYLVIDLTPHHSPIFGTLKNPYSS